MAVSVAQMPWRMSKQKQRSHLCGVQALPAHRQRLKPHPTPPPFACSAFADWRAQLEKGLKVLEDRAIAMAARTIGFDQQLSLIVPAQTEVQASEGIQPTSLFVSWTDPGSWRGRQAVIDEQGRIMYSVPIRLIQSWENCTVIHPAIGLRMRKKKPEHRDFLPKDIAHFQAMWDCALGVTDLMSLCEVCGRRDFGEGDDVAKRCPLCLMVAHPACVEHLAAGEIDVRDVPKSAIPHPFRGSAHLCALCSSWQTS